MKRSWIGFYLLLALLGASLFSSHSMDTLHGEASRQMEQAGELAMAGNWPAAAYVTAKVRRDWDSHALLRCALADHGPMEEIEARFALLEVYGADREATAFAAVCRELSRQLEAMADAHRLRLHNLL